MGRPASLPMRSHRACSMLAQWRSPFWICSSRACGPLADQRLSCLFEEFPRVVAAERAADNARIGSDPDKSGDLVAEGTVVKISEYFDVGYLHGILWVVGDC